MSYTPSLKLNADKCSKITEYLNGLMPNKRNSITLSKMSEATGISIDELGVYVDSLVDNSVLVPRFGLCCPECGIIYESFDNLSDIDLGETYYCHLCEADRKITMENIIVIFSFRNPNDFFQIGQSNSSREIIVAAQDIDEVDYVTSVAEICSSIQQLSNTILAIHNEDREKEEKEQRKAKINGRIKVIIKSVYAIVLLLILLVIVNIVDVEKIGARLDILIFVFSFVSSELINYILEKWM